MIPQTIPSVIPITAPGGAGYVEAYPTVAAKVDIGAIPWTSPEAILADDGIRAWADLMGLETSDLLLCTHFNFAIPGGALIVGVEVIVHEVLLQAGNLYAQLYVSGAGEGDVKVLPWAPTGNDYVVFGGPAIKWGAVLTAAKVNADNFGVQLFAEETENAPKLYRCDSARVKVYYA